MCGKRARLCGPDCVALLHHVVRSDNFASITQRVGAASTLLEAVEFLSSEAKETGLLREQEGSTAPTSGRRPKSCRAATKWQEQAKLSSLRDRWLDPTCTFATATDPVASSAMAGAMRKK
jgi:hypothetical protein